MLMMKCGIGYHGWVYLYLGKTSLSSSAQPSPAPPSTPPRSLTWPPAQCQLRPGIVYLESNVRRYPENGGPGETCEETRQHGVDQRDGGGGELC